MRFVLLAASLLCAPPATAGTIVVDWAGGGDFLDLQPAIDAAVEGDTILVRQLPPMHPPTYTDFAVDGKSIAIVGPAGSAVRSYHGSVVNLAAHQTVVLSGLYIARGLVLEDNAGAVFVRGCSVAGSTSPTGAACSVRASRSVTFVDCGGFGKAGDDSLADGVPGEQGSPCLDVDGSRVALYGTSLRGGAGGLGSHTPSSIGGDGAPALRVVASELFVADTTLLGGDGGWSDILFGGVGPGGDGGAGLELDAASFAVGRAVDARGGDGGLGSPDGASGAAVFGDLVAAPGDGVSLRAPVSDLRGRDVWVRLVDTPGTRVLAFASEGLAWTYRGVRAGVLHAAPPVARFADAIVPACGELALDLTPPLAGSALGTVVQAAVLAPGGGLVLSAPTFVSVLDDYGDARCGGRLYVDGDAAAGGDGASWATAFEHLEAALAAVPACTDYPFEIWVAEGIYRPAPPGGAPTSSFLVESGVQIYGGFDGTETQLIQRDPLAHPTVLSGDLAGDDPMGSRDDNVHHVVEVGQRDRGRRATGVRLDGLVIEGGHARFSTFQTGAGVIADGSLDMVGCTVRDCFANRSGAALSFRGEDARIVACRFYGNRAGTASPTFPVRASGVELHAEPGGRVSVRDTEVVGNTGGAGLWVTGTADVRHSTIVGNAWVEGSAGLFAEVADLSLNNTILWANVGAPRHPDPGPAARVRAYGRVGLPVHRRFGRGAPRPGSRRRGPALRRRGRRGRRHRQRRRRPRPGCGFAVRRRGLERACGV